MVSLPELLLATSRHFYCFVTAFLRNITSDYSSSTTRQSLQDQSSSALDLIASEVRSSQRITTYLAQKADSPTIDKKCLPKQMGEYLFSIELPTSSVQRCLYQNLTSTDYYQAFGIGNQN